MKIEIIKCLQDNFSYLIVDEKTQIACVVDPSEAKPIINFLNNKKINLKYILNTHHHYDRVGGNKELKKKYKLNKRNFLGHSDIAPLRKIDPGELKNFVGCFLTGTAAEVTPVSCIAENQFKVCDLIIGLNESYQKLVRNKKAA